MEGFAERLHDAMNAAGIFTPEELATRCGWSVSRVHGMIGCDGDCLTRKEWVTLRGVLRCRILWLMGEAGPPEPITTLEGQVAEAVIILCGLGKRQAARWLTIGKEMTKG